MWRCVIGYGRRGWRRNVTVTIIVVVLVVGQLDALWSKLSRYGPSCDMRLRLHQLVVMTVTMSSHDRALTVTRVAIITNPSILKKTTNAGL